MKPAEKQVRSLTIRIKSVTIRGPLEEQYWVRPEGLHAFLPEGCPGGPAERRAVCPRTAGAFCDQGVPAAGGPGNRRSAGDICHRRLHAGRTNLRGRHRPGDDGRAGVTRLSVSRGSAASGSSDPFPLIDEYALAARLSYFLWSSMPDEELFRLAGANKLRENLHAQVTRMLADARSEEFVRHFVGQWLQARDIESVQINAFAVISRDDVRPTPRWKSAGRDSGN